MSMKRVLKKWIGTDHRGHPVDFLLEVRVLESPEVHVEM